MVEMRKRAPVLVNIRVELFGLARMVCGRRHVDIAVPEQAEPGDVVAVLSKTCPELVGKAILEDCSALQESYTFNLNGEQFVSEGRLHLKPGDSLLLFSSQAGG